MFVVGGGNYIEYQNLVDYAKVPLVPLLQDTVTDFFFLFLFFFFFFQSEQFVIEMLLTI